MKLPKIITILLLPFATSAGDIPKNTANYYILNADRFLGKYATLHIEDINLVGPLADNPNLTQFNSLTWHGMETHGTANILVDTKDAKRFYEKYSPEDGYQQSNSIGTKNNAGWKSKRLRCLFVKNAGTYYFYTGNINPFMDIEGAVTLRRFDGKSIKCKIVGVSKTKIKVIRIADNQTFVIDIVKLDGDSQRLVRNWKKI